MQPILLEDATTFAMANDLWRHLEMLSIVRYASSDDLLEGLVERIIAPAEAKVAEIRRERATAFFRSGLVS